MSCVETRAYISITSAICGANFDLKKVLSSLLLFVQRQPRDNAYCQRVLFFFVRRTSSLQKNKGHSLFSIFLNLGFKDTTRSIPGLIQQGVINLYTCHSSLRESLEASILFHWPLFFHFPFAHLRVF